MKKIIFSLALMLTATFTFANTVEGYSGQSDEYEMADALVSAEGYTLGDEPEALVFDCTIKGTITIIFPDGTRYTVENATITFVGVSCGKLLKELMS